MYRLSHFINDGHLNQPLLEAAGKAVYYSTGLSVSLLDREGSQLYHLGSHGHLTELFPLILDEFSHFAKIQLSSGKDEICTFESVYNYNFIVLCFKNAERYLGAFLMGPFTPGPIDEHKINQVMNDAGFNMSDREKYKTFFDELPMLSTSRHYFIQQTILAALTNDLFDQFYPESQLKVLTEEHVQNASPEDLKKAEHNYPLELLFLTKVKNGDIEKVVDLYNEHIKTQYLNFSGNNPVRGAKNKALSLSTLLARAVIDGGVENEKSLALEDHFLRKIEDAKDLSELVFLVEAMVVQYTNSVLQLSSINHVNVIKNASKYVHLHLSEPIRLNDVAGYVNLSPNYFSSLFKREMNLSFADYVNQTRIKESQYLLETTDYSILDIAISVGYNNQNYFTTIFRKFTGITPKQYRMRSAK